MKPNLSRRQFLAHSAGIAGASLGLGVPRAGRGGGPGEEVRLGFIGLGDRGRHLLGAALRADREGIGPQARVTALCDVDPRSLQRALAACRADADSSAGRPAPRGFTSYRALLDDREVDAVFIATPVHQHATQAICALASGKHVYCEKPLAHEADGCRDVLAAARAGEGAGQVFQVGFQRRYNPRYRASVRFVQEGKAGRVLFARAQWHATGGSPRDKPWIFRRERSGGAVLEQACHQFDVFNWLLGAAPERACGFGGTGLDGDPPGRDTMDHYGAVVEYAGGVRVHMSHVSFAIPERRFSGIYELVFGRSMGVDLPNALAWAQGSDGSRARKLLEEPGAPAEGARDLAVSDTQLAVEAFLESAAAGKAAEAGIDVGYRATLAAILCRRALETGRVVHWKEIEPA